MGGVPSVPADRSRTLQVIGAGYSRTGTLSTTVALETLLEGPVLHTGTQLFGREDAYAKLWSEVYAHRHDKPVLMKLLREATAGFVGITDMFAVNFLRELVELYPDAKVVLVTRDPARWYKSMEPLMKSAGRSPWVLQALLWPCPTWRWTPPCLRGMRECDEERITAEFDSNWLLLHQEYVRAHVPASRLMSMELSQGWEPLAKFLDKPVPDVPFPRVNDAEALEAFAKKVFVTAVLTWLGILVSVGGGLWLLWRFC